jgi:hypothetical protein
MSKVAETVMLPSPGGSATDAVAVEPLNVPESVAVATVAGPTEAVGTTRTETVVPAGMLAPSMFTATTPVTAVANEMSGVERFPDGLAGAFTPFTDAMRNAGNAVGIGRAGN